MSEEILKLFLFVNIAEHFYHRLWLEIISVFSVTSASRSKSMKNCLMAIRVVSGGHILLLRKIRKPHGLDEWKYWRPRRSSATKRYLLDQERALYPPSLPLRKVPGIVTQQSSFRLYCCPNLSHRCKPDLQKRDGIQIQAITLMFST